MIRIPPPLPSFFDLWLSKAASAVFRFNAGQRVASRKNPAPKHSLILYDYESSPWCRLVREQLSVLGLSAEIRPCPRESMWQHGAFSSKSRFRAEAFRAIALESENIGKEGDAKLSFPILVDQTTTIATDGDGKAGTSIVIKESFEIVEHLWDYYGTDVMVPSKPRRPDQLVNSPYIPFPIRFLFLVGPTVLCRIFPLSECIYKWLRVPSSLNNVDTITPDAKMNTSKLTLFQMEGCPESRLVREILCGLEIPYTSSPISQLPRNFLTNDSITDRPVLLVQKVDERGEEISLTGYKDIAQHLWSKYYDPNSEWPTIWSTIEAQENQGQNATFGGMVYVAFLKGRRAFVPNIAQK